MNEFIVLLRLNAKNEDDMKEIIECYNQEHPNELNYWTQIIKEKEEIEIYDNECPFCQSKEVKLKDRNEFMTQLKCQECKKRINLQTIQIIMR